MTQGFTRPFTPGGTASILAPLPWKFAYDLLVIHFRTDPKALAKYLPAPLTPLDDSGEAFLWSPRITCHPVAGDPAAQDAAMSGYNVCVIAIPAKLNGKPTMFSAFQWCDRDWLIVLSWFIGATSKGAVIEQTSVHPLMDKLGSPNSGKLGGQIHRTVSRFGNRVIDMTFRPDREIAVTDMDFFTSKLPLTGMRHLPDIHIPPTGKPPIHDLVQQVMTQTTFGTPLAGAATLKFFDVANEELMPIAPKEVLGGYSLPMANLLEGIRVVHDYNA